MTNLIKKLLVVFIFTFFAFQVVFVNATDQQDFSAYYREVECTDTEVFNNVLWKQIYAETRTDHPTGRVAGLGSEGSIDPNTWYGQHINILEVPRLQGNDGNSAYKVVAWSVQASESWQFAGATAIAEDYERTHPDYMVLGGINADFYDWHTTLDYPNSGNGMEIRDGDIVRALLTSWGAVGVKNDLSDHQLVYAMPTNETVVSNQFVLEIYDKDGILQDSLTLSGINGNTINDNETYAYFGHNEIIYDYEYETYIDTDGTVKYVLDGKGEKVLKLDAAGMPIHRLNSYDEWSITRRDYHTPTLPDDADLYYVTNADLLIYQAEENSYFGKGEVAGVNLEHEFDKNTFVIGTKSEEVKQLLSLDGAYIKVQRQLLGDFANIQNATGAYLPLVQNGVYARHYGEVDYFTTRAPRTLIGCKDDGTICLITMDGRQASENSYGTNQDEINGTLQYYGITDAFLLDGGGSTTFFVRENGQFVVKNSPSDGRQRSVGNGYLVVVKKDNAAEISECLPSENSLQFNVKINDSENVKNCYVSLNIDGVDQRFLVKNGTVTISDLPNQTKYEVKLFYENNYGDIIQTTSIATYYTNKILPTVKITGFKYEEGYAYPTFEINDPDNALKLIIVETNNDFMIYSDDEEAENKIRVESGNNFHFDVTYTYQLNPKGPSDESVFVYEYAKPFDQPIEQPQPREESKGCGKASALVLSTLAFISLGYVIIRKKNN